MRSLGRLVPVKEQCDGEQISVHGGEESALKVRDDDELKEGVQFQLDEVVTQWWLVYLAVLPHVVAPNIHWDDVGDAE